MKIGQNISLTWANISVTCTPTSTLPSWRIGFPPSAAANTATTTHHRSPQWSAETMKRECKPRRIGFLTVETTTFYFLLSTFTAPARPTKMPATRIRSQAAAARRGCEPRIIGFPWSGRMTTAKSWKGPSRAISAASERMRRQATRHETAETMSKSQIRGRRRRRRITTSCATCRTSSLHCAATTKTSATAVK
jgi:hypothetical protein